MKRYKELKYEKKTYTEQWKIDEILIKNGFQWFIDCEVEDVRIEILKKTLIMNSGTFFNGTWVYGAWRDGIWKYGTWVSGVWFNGKWIDGIFQDGIIKDGKFFNGRMETGTIDGGDFYHMEISKDVKRNDIENQNKEEIIQNDQMPQGEKISERVKMKKFNEFVNEDIKNIEDIEEIQPDEDEDIEEIGLDDVKVKSELDVKPSTSVVNRAEEWKNLSENPGSRIIFKTMGDFLASRGMSNFEEEIPKKTPNTRRGVRRKK